MKKKVDIGQIQFKVSGYKTNKILQTYRIALTNDMSKGSSIGLSNVFNPIQNYIIIELKEQIELKQDVEIMKLTTENSVKLNDLASEELNQMFKKLGDKITKSYEEAFKNLYMNKLLENAQNAQKKYEEAETKEKEQLQEYIDILEQRVPANNN